MAKWKFFYNGYTWWLKIETVEQLEAYIDATDSERFGGSMMRVANHRMEEVKAGKRLGHLDANYDGMAAVLDGLNSLMHEDLLTTTGRLVDDCHHTYFKNFARAGFVNINRLGGCNSCDGPDFAEKIVMYSDKLVFPMLSRQDVTIKTWELQEKAQYLKRPYNYKYHWYCYVGDVQLKDGDIAKWDTRAEAEAFVDRLFQKG